MICRSQRNLIAEALTSLGLYAGQEMFSWQLWHEDGLTQSEIVDRICVQHPTVSKMLNRLEKAGLVTRHTDPQYSRTTHVFLTPEGRDLEHKVCYLMSQHEGKIAAQMRVEERVLLRRLLLQVNANIDHNP